MTSRREMAEQLTRQGAFELVTDETLGYPRRVYRHAPANMRGILESTRQFDDRVFVVYEDEETTYCQHYERVTALAHHLIAEGIGKGDRVAIGMRNYPEWIISFWACQAIGAVAVAINAWWTGAEITFAIEDSGVSALLIDGERLERLVPLVDLSQFRCVVVARRGNALTGGADFAEAITKPAPLPDIDIGPEDPATILYTSGTTGKPKGAVATQRNHITNFMNTLLGGAVARGLAGDFSTPSPTDGPQPAGLQTFPFFHIGGLTGLYVNTGIGAKLVLMYKWDPVQAVKLIVQHGISSVAGVPIVVRQLLEAARNSGADISSLVGVASGGSSVPPDLIRQIESDFQAKAAPGNGYGLTETTSAVITNSGAEYFAHPDSVGQPVVTAEAKIVDDAGNTRADDEIGELWIRGANVVQGYWRNPEATEAEFGGGWFRTGDLGYRDKDGFYYVVDRKKDVIIRGGENVYCAEVEAVILEHPLVRDAAVIGLPDPDYGEQVAAVLQVDNAEEAQYLADELRETLLVRLARFKVPSSFRLIESELPRTATGKVLKRDLRDMFSRE